MEDASADLIRVRNGLTSTRRVHAAAGIGQGEVAKEIVDDRATELAMAQQTADALNKQFPGNTTPFTWRDVLPQPTSEGVAVSLQPSKPDGNSAARPTDNGR
jgi:hypothetical protein